MAHEFEIKFRNIDIEQLKSKMSSNGFKIKSSQSPTKTALFSIPGFAPQEKFARVREKNGKVSLSIKQNKDNTAITGLYEIELPITDFDMGIKFLLECGLTKNSFCESISEFWSNDHGIEIKIDKWPHLDPFIEIEGESENDVHQIVAKLELNYSAGEFTGMDQFYAEKYDLSLDRIHKMDLTFTNECLTKLKNNK